MAEPDWEKSGFSVRSLVCGLVVAIAGILCVWIATRQTSPAMNAFLAGIGTALITAALLGLVYESYLKWALIRDIRESSNIESELYRVGLAKVSLDRDLISMRDLFGTATVIDIVPLHPLTWLDSESPWLTYLARQRPLHCRIHLPEPTTYSQFLKDVDNSAGELTTTEFCSAKFRECSKHWDHQRDEQLMKSSMELLYYSGYPQAGFVISDQSAVIYVGNARPNSVDFITYIYKGDLAKPTIERLRQIIKRLNSVPISGATADMREAEDILPRKTRVDEAQPRITAEEHLLDVKLDRSDQAGGQ